ncbi:hypothetical protein PICMEDRAFT_15562 [Pichia membranifaciens NRRL Y-2026]|uniref:Uncharacterized protein n=1 Tax=Pichia membranifaciens NRRL Y-2026 TaxID=763406 RepID=A0A1E3NPI5_9ASCO|nr:hypothetical protein PICMEDRAFT_15562 [Pichia membranifaciens NRRL Y-2026]ODQ47628.1 hypothetical protein PICMEDRAFT_15562 [Pichia membranifaciens NRRL Y-2026]
MFVKGLERRDEFYSDLTPITNDIMTTGTLTSSPASEVTNNLASQATDSSEALLTDSDTSAFHLTSGFGAISSSTASVTVTTGGKDSSDQKTTSAKLTHVTGSSSTVSPGDYKHQVSSSYKNAAGYHGGNKKKTLIFGLLGSSFLFSLL